VKAVSSKELPTGQEATFLGLRVEHSDVQQYNLSAVTIGEGSKALSPKRPKLKTLTWSQYHQMTEPSAQHALVKPLRYQVARTQRIEMSSVGLRWQLQIEICYQRCLTTRRRIRVLLQPDAPQVQKQRLFSAITRHGEGAQETEGVSEIDQFNFELLKDKHWGAFPPIKDPVIPNKLLKDLDKKPSRNSRFTH
jgi:hypothetical protein